MVRHRKAHHQRIATRQRQVSSVLGQSTNATRPRSERKHGRPSRGTEGWELRSISSEKPPTTCRPQHGVAKNAETSLRDAVGLTAAARMHELAEAILRGEGDPIRLAMQIYGTATEYGGWYGEPGNVWADASCPELAEPGVEFLLLASALKEHQDKPEGRAAYADLIREAAEAYLRGMSFPEWHDRGDPVPWRPDGGAGQAT
jgi:hypothetical protein